MKFTIVYLFLAAFIAVSTAQTVEVTISGGSGSPLTVTTTEDITFTGVTPNNTIYGFYLVDAAAGNTTESTSPHSGTISWDGTGDDSGTGTMGALGLSAHELTNVFMLWSDNGNAPTTTETMTLTAGSRTTTGNVDADVVVGTSHYQIFMTGIFGTAISAAGTQPQPLTYVDAEADFVITTDQGAPGVLDAGDVVSWQPVSGAPVTGLVFGTDAFTSVQAAVDAVDEGGTVRVAAGTYDEGAEIVISKTMTLEGEGNELTSLSGGGDGDFATVDPSAHRVVYLPPGSHLDPPHITIRRLSIVNGEVTGYGGGLYSHWSTSLTMENCTVSGNIASDNGGGVCFYAGGQYGTITDCTFEGNKSMGNGGGLCADYGPILIVERSTFYNNGAIGPYTVSGGGIWVNTGYATIYNCTVSANTANYQGGGIYYYSEGFYSSIEGLESYLTTGAIACTTIVKNTAGVEGGGLYGFSGQQNSQLLIVGNDAPINPDASSSAAGPAIVGFEDAGVSTLEEIIEPLADNGGATLTHKLVWGSNAIDTYTSNLWFDLFDIPLLLTDQRGRPRQFGRYHSSHNVIMADHGAVEYNELEIASSIPADRSTLDTAPSTISITFNATMGLTYSNLPQVVLRSNGTGGVVPCSVTADGDTITITPDSSLPPADSYSVEINDLVATHTTGVTYGPEASSVLTFQLCTTEEAYVDAVEDFTVDGDYVTFQAGSANEVTGLVLGVSAFTDVQSAIDHVCSGGTVYIGPGVYDEGEELHLARDMNLTGLGAGLTILSGGDTHRGVYVAENAEVVLNDLSVTAGLAGDDVGLRSSGLGGGLYSSKATVTLNGVIVSDCTATNQGGGIYFESWPNMARQLTLTGSALSDNTSNGDGGGLYTVFSTVTLTDSTVSGNTSARNGGGINTERGILNLKHCTLHGNSAPNGNGGGYFAQERSHISEGSHLNHCTVTGNSAKNGGGLANRTHMSLTNTLVAGNTATVSIPDFQNLEEVYWLGMNFIGNTSGFSPGNFVSYSAGQTLADLVETSGGIPVLADNGGPTPTVALITGSPAVNAGDNASAGGLPYDQRGSGFNRISGGTVDIGAYELRQQTPLLDWRILHGLDSAGADDLGNPSGDGVSNLLKYAFNLAPSVGDLQTSNHSMMTSDGVAGLPLIERVEGPQLSVTYVRRKASSFPGITYQPYTGIDLSDLDPLNQSSATVTSIDDHWERVTIVDPVSTESRFGRVEVTE